jgi:hypothetical protein
MADSKIGVASATKNEVQGIRGAEKRSLETGSEIFLNEAVQTGDESVAQLVFLDNTNLSVGPGSLVQLDKFVYDSNRGTREVIFEVGRGAFRFATGGRGPKSYSLKTHAATLGIRGTVFELVSTDNEVKIKLNEGLIQVRTIAGQIVWMTRPDTLLVVYANGTVQGPVPYQAPIIQFVRLEANSTGSSASTTGGGGVFDQGFNPRSDSNRRSFRSRDTGSSKPAEGDSMPFGSPFSRNAPATAPQKSTSTAEPISPSR